jgi:Zn-dependent peptidase ImmA (M78 family)
MIINRPSIKSAITEVYKTAEIDPTSLGNFGIVPLRILIGAFNLECIELPNLSAKAAIEFLSKYDSTIQQDGGVDETLLAGYIYVTTSFGCIFVNQSDRITRRRFSVAHELGHFLLHFRPILDALKREGEIVSFHHADQTVADDETEDDYTQGKNNMASHNTALIDYEGYLPSFNQMEVEADAFASELLIPNNILMVRLASLNLIDDLLGRHLATEFLVSRSAMERRLKELELA